MLKKPNTANLILSHRLTQSKREKHPNQNLWRQKQPIANFTPTFITRHLIAHPTYIDYVTCQKLKSLFIFRSNCIFFLETTVYLRTRKAVNSKTIQKQISGYYGWLHSIHKPRSCIFYMHFIKLQSFAKNIWNLLGFIEDLNLK